MIPSRLVALLVVPVLLLFGSAAPAEDAPVLSRIVKSGVVRVGMSGDQPPLNMQSKTGQVIGMEADLAALLARAMGVELQIVTRPFAELLPAVRKGEVDLVISGMTITPARNLEVAFVGPYFVSGKSVLTKSATLAKITEADAIDDASVTLAALAGSTSQKYVESAAPAAKLALVPDYAAGVKAVIDGKADALVADFPICVLSVLRYPEEGLSTLVTPLTIEPIGVALPPGDPLLLNLVENYLSALQGTGELERLRARWFDDGSWLSELP